MASPSSFESVPPPEMSTALPASIPSSSSITTVAIHNPFQFQPPPPPPARDPLTILVSRKRAQILLQVAEIKRKACIQFASGTSFTGKNFNKTQQGFAEYCQVRLEKKIRQLKTFIDIRDHLEHKIDKLLREDNVEGACAMAYTYNKFAAPTY